MNYFAVQVVTGKEDSYIELLSKSRPDLSVYSIKKKLASRRGGKPVQQITCLFPGYLFLQCPDEMPSVPIVQVMRRTKSFLRFLPSTDDIRKLSDRDAEIIRHLLSFGKEIGPSLVTFDENNRIKVLQGPMMGYEGRIVKVNRRKRRAKVMLDLNDSQITFDFGFEILEQVKAKPS